MTREARETIDGSCRFERFDAPRPTSWAEAGERLRAFSAECAFDDAIYLSLRPDPRTGGGMLQITTCRADRRGHALDHDAVTLDPLPDAVRGLKLPFEWASLGADEAALRAFVGIAPERRGRGITVPIHGPGHVRALFSVATSGDVDDWAERCRALTPHLHIFGWEFHRSVSTLLADLETSTAMPTPRELEVLRRAAEGRTARQTARVLGLSEETVQDYIRDVVKRLGCINKTHAVAVAVRRGLI